MRLLFSSPYFSYTNKTLQEHFANIPRHLQIMPTNPLLQLTVRRDWMSKMNMSRCCYREYIQGTFWFVGIGQRVCIPVCRSIQLPLCHHYPISTRPYDLCTQGWGFLYSSKIIGTFLAPFRLLFSSFYRLFLSFAFIVCFLSFVLFARFCSLVFFACFLRLLSSLVLSLVLSLVFIACFLQFQAIIPAVPRQPKRILFSSNYPRHLLSLKDSYLHAIPTHHQ